jgi:hypothetical protein
MDDREYSPRDDSHYSGEAPTFSGYSAYITIVDSNDHAHRRDLEKKEFEEWQKHWFKPKPAIVHYEELNKSEQLLSDRNASSHFSKGIAFVARAREDQLPRLEASADRKATAEFIKTRYGQWEQDHLALQVSQKASFDEDVAKSVRLRQEHPENKQSLDTSMFFAREEVVKEYCNQHDDLNKRFEHDIVGFVDHIVETQIERNGGRMGSEGAALDEIIRRPRMSERGPDRDDGRER